MTSHKHITHDTGTSSLTTEVCQSVLIVNTIKLLSHCQQFNFKSIVTLNASENNCVVLRLSTGYLLMSKVN